VAQGLVPLFVLLKSSSPWNGGGALHCEILRSHRRFLIGVKYYLRGRNRTFGGKRAGFRATQSQTQSLKLEYLNSLNLT